MALRDVVLGVALAVLSTIGAGCGESCNPPQTRLCQPCGSAGCKVPGWPNAVCNGGVCRPVCAGGDKFDCFITASNVRRAKCVGLLQESLCPPGEVPVRASPCERRDDPAGRLDV